MAYPFQNNIAALPQEDQASSVSLALQGQLEVWAMHDYLLSWPLLLLVLCLQLPLVRVNSAGTLLAAAIGQDCKHVGQARQSG